MIASLNGILTFIGKSEIVLEVNGVGTGLGERGYAYDLNSVVASKLREHVVKYE